MPFNPLQLTTMSDAQRGHALAAAAEALRTGSLIILPTETVYGVAANAASDNAINALRELSTLAQARGHRGLAAGPLTWHAPDIASPIRTLAIRHPLHRRLLNKLSPGPVRWLVDINNTDLAAARASLAVPHALLDDGASIPVRIPDHPICRAVLAAVPSPIVICGLIWLGLGDGHDLSITPADAASSKSPMLAKISLALDSGPTPVGQVSTSVRLKAGGGYDIASPGAVPEAAIARALDHSILLVCTGNTCRSPMAESIARTLLAHDAALGATTKVASAGVGASPGSPATRESSVAIASLALNDAPTDAREAPLAGFRSRQVSRSMVDDADAIFAMTAGHRDTLIDLYPGAARRIHLLDPAGADIDDPIGSPQHVYNLTAQRLRDVIADRISRGEF